MQVLQALEYFLIFSIGLGVALGQERKKSRLSGGGRPFGDEARLLRQLLKGYEKAVRPVANASHTISVRVNFALTQILDMDEKNQVLTTNVWFSQEWKDEKLVWNPEDFNGLKKIRIPPDLVWRPDIVLYNGAGNNAIYLYSDQEKSVVGKSKDGVDDYGDKVYSQCLAMVFFDGTVFWAPIANLRSTCKLDLTFFPFDDQVCTYKVGSWTYDGFQVDLTNKSEKMDLDQYTVNGGWDLIGTKTRRNVVYYPCCPEPYPDVTFTVYLRRRTLYYIMNVVVPCLLLSGLSLLGFWLPVGTSEKVSLGLTVLLAFYVLGLSLADRIPETSEFVPLIGVYLMVIMILTSISVAMCVFILHLHRLGSRHAHVPPWLFRLVTRYLARLVGLTYILKHYQQPHQVDMAEDPEEINPVQIECEDLNARYKLIQVEGNGLYILARDGDGVIMEKDDKDDLNDLHRVKEKRKVLKAMKAILVRGPVHRWAGPSSEEALKNTEIMWHDMAEVVDRFFFWLCFITVSITTITLLVIMPLSKPDPQTLMAWDERED